MLFVQEYFQDLEYATCKFKSNSFTIRKMQLICSNLIVPRIETLKYPLLTEMLCPWLQLAATGMRVFFTAV